MIIKWYCEKCKKTGDAKLISNENGPVYAECLECGEKHKVADSEEEFWGEE